MEKIVVILLGLYTIIDFTSARGMPYWQVFYIIVFMALFFINVIKLRSNLKVEKKVVYFILMWLLAVVTFLVPVCFQTNIFYNYVVGDIATLILPVLFMICGYLFPNLFLDKRNISLLGIFLIVAAFIGPFMVEKSYGGRLYDPPHILLIVIAWGWLFAAQRKLYWYLNVLLLICLFVLAFESGQRTNVLFVIAGGFVMLYLRKWPVQQKFLLGIVTALTIAILSGSMIFSSSPVNKFISSFNEKLEETRFGLIMDGPDTSILGRINEIRDIFYNNKQNSILFSFTGNGHGATFIPYYSFPERNMTEGGRVHNIHVGLALLYYRYGFTGISLWAALLITLVRDLFRLKRFDNPYQGNRYVELFFTVGLVLSIVNFMLRNVLVDPLFSYMLGGYLYIKLHYRSSIRSSSKYPTIYTGHSVIK